MRVLAIETASEACSVALFEDDGRECIGHRHEILGRGHAERLVPMIAELPDRGRAGRICVSLGPGSFTGVRIGIAAARALALAWRTEIAGYPTLALVAAQGMRDHGGPVSVCMEGGHSQWFVQNFDEYGHPQDDVRSLPRADAAGAARHPVVVGSRAGALAAMSAADRTATDMLPDARSVPLLSEALMSGTIAPVYGRAPDAKPQGSPKP
ncbi:tRNA (adenosine(37)-N6)-threonylcarbamoyltransferase complex dimerization subunit type 1 TsaB [Qipengyuania sp. JC766]|uniref:tRNA (adenosine(37)-N6)-threonylcarbamoyltransferase complex dimerization subunit type 1 TsaB n=1 Tax=Qipengyuania sp. JC766 TaxID=3232139 RepID=UPI00345A5682